MKLFDRGLKLKFFIAWTLSLCIPLMLFAVVNFMVTGGEKFPGENFQRNGFINGAWKAQETEKITDIENISKKINNVILVGETDVYFEIKNIIMNEENVKNDNIIMIIRKNDELSAVNEKSLKVKAVLNTFKSGIVNMPTFASDEKIDYEEIFEATGYSANRQMDFIYNDHNMSILFLRKYTNPAWPFLKLVFDNMMTVFVIMIIVHFVVTYRISKYVADPIYNMIETTSKIKEGELSARTDLRVRDTALGKLTKSINEMAEELEFRQNESERFEEDRKEFIANISHDIKTPLTSIKIHIEAIKDGVVSTEEKKSKYYKNINAKINDITAMVNELALYSELETGRGKYQYHKVNIDWFIRDVLDQLRYDYENENVSIEYDNELLNEEIIDIDVDKFRRVITNIVINSTKYAKRDDLKIKVRIYKKNNDIVLTITDNGIGVKKDQLDNLFDKFYRADISRNQDVSGSGLGLSIVKSIINNHNGFVSAESEYGEYFKIIVTLKAE